MSSAHAPFDTVWWIDALAKYAKEFPGVAGPDDLAKIVDNVLAQPSASKDRANGRQAFYDAASNTLVLLDPRNVDGGTVFRPKRGRDYFNRLK